jgi:hypothetical protein
MAMDSLALRRRPDPHPAYPHLAARPGGASRRGAADLRGTPPVGAGPEPAGGVEPRVGHDFSRTPLRSRAGADEREADRTAGAVMRMPVAGINPVPGRTPPRAAGASSAGRPLDAGIRAFMEPRFGRDFGGVRVHTDAGAAESARAMDALAYTRGADVVFDTGRYAPGTAEGRGLLAHELAHVVQQEQGGARLQRQEKPGTPAVPKLAITGVIAAGGELAPETILAVNAAAPKVPAQWRRFVAYEGVVKVGGSLAWRANNPGNLRGAPTQIATVPGASGSFAVFATLDDGRAAQRALYLSVYGDQTVRVAVTSLTPPNENDTAKYLKRLEAAGVKLDSTMRSQIDVLMPAVQANEGLIEGLVVPRPAPPGVVEPRVTPLVVPVEPVVPDKTRVAPSPTLLDLPPE